MNGVWDSYKEQRYKHYRILLSFAINYRIFFDNYEFVCSGINRIISDCCRWIIITLYGLKFDLEFFFENENISSYRHT